MLGIESFVVQKQEAAGSLANLCPSSYLICSESVDELEDKHNRKMADVENEEVILICEFELLLTMRLLSLYDIIIDHRAFRKQWYTAVLRKVVLPECKNVHDNADRFHG